MKWTLFMVACVAAGFGWALLLDCGGIPKPPSGSAICVDMTDSGPQASVSAGGITVTVPLMKLTVVDAGGE